jgi:hypothetical protein
MREMNTNDMKDAARRLAEAEAKLAQVVHRLRQLQFAALYGRYDAVEFDRAVVAYREARAEARDARNAWAEQSRQAAAGLAGDNAPAVAAPAAPQPEPPFEPTPKMRFVRWLVQTGRLSDWAEEPAAVAAF